MDYEIRNMSKLKNIVVFIKFFVSLIYQTKEFKNLV